MTKKLVDDSTSAKRKFRGKLGSRDFSVLDRDENYEYRWVITTYDNNLDQYERVENFIDKGWDVVYSDERPKDERSAAPDNDSKNSDRLKPVTKRLRGGHTAVLLKCSKEQRQKNEQEKAQRDKLNEIASAKSIKTTGNAVKTELPDIDLKSIDVGE